MADYTRRERTDEWVEFVLPRPTYSGEMGKAFAAARHELPENKRDFDDSIVVDATDEEIVLRIRKYGGSRTMTVHWAESSVERARDTMQQFYDGILTALVPQSDTVSIAISALNMAAGDDAFSTEWRIDTADRLRRLADRRLTDELTGADAEWLRDVAEVIGV